MTHLRMCTNMHYLRRRIDEMTPYIASRQSTTMSATSPSPSPTESNILLTDEHGNITLLPLSNLETRDQIDLKIHNANIRINAIDDKLGNGFDANNTIASKTDSHTSSIANINAAIGTKQSNDRRDIWAAIYDERNHLINYVSKTELRDPNFLERREQNIDYKKFGLYDDLMLKNTSYTLRSTNLYNRAKYNGRASPYCLATDSEDVNVGSNPHESARWKSIQHNDGNRNDSNCVNVTFA